MSDFIESQTLINFIVIEHVLLLLILSAAGYWAFFYIKDKRNYVSFLEALFNDYAHGILIFDKKQQLQYANNNGHSFLKDIYPNADPIKYLNECFDLFFDHAQDMDHVLESVLKNVKDQLPDRKIDYREIVKTKSNNFYFLTGYKTDDSQTTIHVIDINVEKRYEDLASRLGQTNQQLFQAIETTNTGIVVVSMQRAKNTINFVNRAFCEIAGKDRNDFLGADWRQFFSVFEEAKSDEDIHGLIQSIQHEEITDLDLTSFLGSQKRYYNFKITPYMNNKKEVDQYVGVLTDITDLRLREAEIFQSQKLDALGQLSAGIAHDFNNILSIIDGYTKISAKEVVDNENLIGYLNKISHASKRGSNLISRMLTFSRKKITNTSTYDIAEIIKDQESFLYPILDKSISLKINLPDFPIPVECNSDVISQIVMNLVINAQDAMSDGGEININLYTLKHTDLPEQYSNESQVLDYAYLRISDTGSGIDSDVLHQIFDPFFSTKDVGKGTGLGLSTVYGFVQDMDGDISVESKLERGTTFHIYLPLSQKKIKNIRIQSDAEKTLNLECYTAIVVDDEPDIVEITASYLEGLGMQILKAYGGNEALEIQDDYEGEIDLLLTDVMMPDLNGVRLAEMFEALRPDTKVIFVSGYAEDKWKGNLHSPESKTLLPKPIDYDELSSVIGDVLSSSYGHTRGSLGESQSSDTIVTGV